MGTAIALMLSIGAVAFVLKTEVDNNRYIKEREKMQEAIDKMDKADEERDRRIQNQRVESLNVGDIVVYKQGDKCELGKIRSIDAKHNLAFVWFNEGTTSSITEADKLYPLKNSYCIIGEVLGKGYKFTNISSGGGGGYPTNMGSGGNGGTK